MIRRTLVVVAGLLVSALPAPAATRCVNNFNPSCAPTITIGVFISQAGDTVAIAAGTYPESVTVDKSVKLVGMGTVIIDNEHGTSTSAPVLTVDANDVSLTNLTIRNGRSHGIEVNAGRTGLVMSAVKVLGADGDCLHFNGGNSGAKITAGTFRGCGGDAVDFSAGADLVSIAASTITSTGGIVGMGANAAITGNKISQSANGVVLASASPNAKVATNTFSTIGSWAVNVTGNAATLTGNVVNGSDLDCIYFSGNGATIATNQLNQCGESGIEAAGPNVQIKGNTVRDPGGDAIYVSAGASRPHNAVISLNKVYGTPDGDGIYVLEGNDVTVSGNVVTGAYTGIYVMDGDQPKVTLNTVTSTIEDGIYVSCYDEEASAPCSGGLIQSNKYSTMASDYYGIDVSAPGNTGSFQILSNTVTGGWGGFALSGSSFTVTGNKSYDAGIYGAGRGFWIQGPDHVVTGNQAFRSAGDGFYLDASAGTALSGNTSDHAADDGFDVNTTTANATLTNNKALFSGGVGFQTRASATGTVLTGNVATGNGLGACIANGSATTFAPNSFGTLEQPTDCTEAAGYIGD